MLDIIQKKSIDQLKTFPVNNCSNNVYSFSMQGHSYFVKYYSLGHLNGMYKTELRIINELMCSEIARRVVMARDEWSKGIIIPEYGLVLDGEAVVGVYSDKVKFDCFQNRGSSNLHTSLPAAIGSGIAVLHALRWCLADPDGNNVNTGFIDEAKLKLVSLDYGLANYPLLLKHGAVTDEERGKVGSHGAVTDEKRGEGSDAELATDHDSSLREVDSAFAISLASITGFDPQSFIKQAGLYNEIDGEHHYNVLDLLFADCDTQNWSDDLSGKFHQDLFNTLSVFIQVWPEVQSQIQAYIEDIRIARILYFRIANFINKRVKALICVKEQVRSMDAQSPTSVRQRTDDADSGRVKPAKSKDFYARVRFFSATLGVLKVAPKLKLESKQTLRSYLEKAAHV